MSSYRTSWIGSQAQVLTANASILGRRAIGGFGPSNAHRIPPKLVPSGNPAHGPMVTIRHGLATVAWARLDMARETPLGVDPPVGYITDAAFPDDEAIQTALFDACRQWLQAQGAKSAIAFMSDSIMEGRGIAYDQDSTADATYGLPVNPVYYIDAMKRWGFQVHMDMYEFNTSIVESPYPAEKFVARALKSIDDCQIISMSGEQILDYLPQIIDIYNDSHCENDAYVPLLLSDVAPTANKMAKYVPHKSVIMVFSGDRPIGLLTAIPDFNRLSMTNPMTLMFAQKAIANIRRYRGILFGVARDFRKKGVEVLLYNTFRQNMVKHCDTFIIGWTIETNTPLLKLINRKMGGVETKKYALMRMDL